MSGKTEEEMLHELRIIGNIDLITFHKRVIEILRKRVKGKVTFYVDIENLTITYEVYLNVGRNYYSKITFDEIIRTKYDWSLFLTTFLNNIRDSYLKNIFN